MKKELLFSITKKDFTVTAMRSGGPGGQHQNKVSSAIRIVHNESGAVGECRNYRSQKSNKEEAFKRLVATKKFQVWFKLKQAQVFAHVKSVEEMVTKQVEDTMVPENLKIEFF